MCAAFNDVRAAAPRGANQGPPVLDLSQGMLDPPLADLSFGRAMFIILTTVGRLLRACVGRNQVPNTTDYSVIPCCRSTGCGATQSIRQGPWVRWDAEGVTSPALSAPGLPILSVRTHQIHSYGLLIGSVVRATAYQWLANHSELTLVLHRGWAVVVSKPAGPV